MKGKVKEILEVIKPYLIIPFVAAGLNMNSGKITEQPNMNLNLNKSFQEQPMSEQNKIYSDAFEARRMENNFSIPKQTVNNSNIRLIPFSDDLERKILFDKIDLIAKIVKKKRRSFSSRRKISQRFYFIISKKN